MFITNKAYYSLVESRDEWEDLAIRIHKQNRELLQLSKDVNNINKVLSAELDKAKSEVAREIFEEIDRAHEDCIVILGDMGYLQPYKFEQKIAELKKKYTEGE